MSFLGASFLQFRRRRKSLDDKYDLTEILVVDNSTGNSNTKISNKKLWTVINNFFIKLKKVVTN